MSSTEPSECKNCFGKNKYYHNSEGQNKKLHVSIHVQDLYGF